MSKQAFFYIDDTIWALRDLTRNQPASLFDNPFFNVLKEAHDKYGVKIQLNLFYRTSYFYGNDDFSLADVTDAYKSEWEASSDWLKLGFHAKEEFPDYPHINATYQDVFDLFKTMEKEVLRFAGKDSFTYAVCPHWIPMSKAGVKALYDCGVRLMDATYGEVSEYNGDPASLPHGHALRLLNNRQPETRLYTRDSDYAEIANGICAYNHLTPRQLPNLCTTETVTDEETGMQFKVYISSDCCLNLIPLNELEEKMSIVLGDECIGICDHEQYFYEDYLAYQPDYAERIYKMADILTQNGYEFIFVEDLTK